MGNCSSSSNNTTAHNASSIDNHQYREGKKVVPSTADCYSSNITDNNTCSGVATDMQLVLSINPSVTSSLITDDNNILEKNDKEDKIYLDDTRKKFLQYHCKVIDELVKGELEERNRYRILLLGNKAVGKSTMRFRDACVVCKINDTKIQISSMTTISMDR
jgi:hypothetical protein